MNSKTETEVLDDAVVAFRNLSDNPGNTYALQKWEDAKEMLKKTKFTEYQVFLQAAATKQGYANNGPDAFESLAKKLKPAERIALNYDLIRKGVDEFRKFANGDKNNRWADIKSQLDSVEQEAVYILAVSDDDPDAPISNAQIDAVIQQKLGGGGVKREKEGIKTEADIVKDWTADCCKWL